LFFFISIPILAISTLSLHDALPICFSEGAGPPIASATPSPTETAGSARDARGSSPSASCDLFSLSHVVARPYHFNKSISSSRTRSEEHTSELQSHLNLVCRLLLEKK